MIDIHCHILPDLDDGPATLDEAVEMCRIAAADGIETIVATPHYRPGRYEWQDVAQRIELLQNELRARKIPLRLLPGADVTVTPELPVQLSRQPQLTINGTGAYFLAELPHDAVPARWEEFLLSFLARGVTPIITHPERNHWFLSHPGALDRFVQAGGMVQITAMSLMGQNGNQSLDYCRHLLKRNLVHVVATDAHSTDLRPPRLSDAVRAAAAIVGEERARRLVRDIPSRIIDGMRVEALQVAAEGVRKRRWYHRMLDI